MTENEMIITLDMLKQERNHIEAQIEYLDKANNNLAIEELLNMLDYNNFEYTCVYFQLDLLKQKNVNKLMAMSSQEYWGI